MVFVGHKHIIYAFFMIPFGLFDSLQLFVCKICHVNCLTEHWKETKLKKYGILKILLIQIMVMIFYLNKFTRAQW